MFNTIQSCENKSKTSFNHNKKDNNSGVVSEKSDFNFSITLMKVSLEIN